MSDGPNKSECGVEENAVGENKGEQWTDEGLYSREVRVLYVTVGKFKQVDSRPGEPSTRHRRLCSALRPMARSHGLADLPSGSPEH